MIVMNIQFYFSVENLNFTLWNEVSSFMLNVESCTSIIFR